MFARARAAPRRGRALPRGVRGARRSSTSAPTTCVVVIDPIDGSLNAKRGLPHDGSRSPSPTGRRWPTSCSATSPTSAPARSGSPAAARACMLDGERAARPAARAPQPRRQARARRDRVRRPALDRAGDGRAAGAASTASARSARSRSRSCQVAARARRRHGDAVAHPRGRLRRRRSSSSARAAASSTFPGFPDARRAAGPRAARARCVAARTARGPRASWPALVDGRTDDRLGPGRADRRLVAGEPPGGTALAGDLDAFAADATSASPPTPA